MRHATVFTYVSHEETATVVEDNGGQRIRVGVFWRVDSNSNPLNQLILDL